MTEDSPFSRAEINLQQSAVSTLVDRLKLLHDKSHEFSKAAAGFGQLCDQLGGVCKQSWDAMDIPVSAAADAVVLPSAAIPAGSGSGSVSPTAAAAASVSKSLSGSSSAAAAAANDCTTLSGSMTQLGAVRSSRRCRGVGFRVPPPCMRVRARTFATDPSMYVRVYMSVCIRALVLNERNKLF